MPNLAANQNAGAVAHCERCGDLCKVAPDKNPNATMLRAADEPKGQCVNCAVAEWFFAIGLTEAHPDLPAGLNAKPVQEQFGRLMKTAISDATLTEINWTKVIANWNLPFKGAKKARGGRRVSK